jgi:uncharacterized protein YeaO (DUF488 family)
VQVSLLKEQMKKGIVTLVYAAKDEDHNEALVLKELFNPHRTGKDKMKDCNTKYG